MASAHEHDIRQFYERADDAMAAFRFRLIRFARGRGTWKRALPELATPVRLIPALRLQEEWESLRPQILRAAAKPVAGLTRRLEFLDALLAASTKIGDSIATAQLLSDFSLSLMNSARLPMAARKKALKTLGAFIGNDAISPIERARLALLVADANLRTGNLLESLRWLRRSRRLDPSAANRANGLVLVAKAEILSGRSGLAVQHLARATQLLLRACDKGPEFQVAQRLLVLALIRQGDYTKASAMLQLGGKMGISSVESLTLQMLAMLEAPSAPDLDAIPPAQALVKLLGGLEMWYPYTLLHLQIGKAIVRSGRNQESIIHIDSARRMSSKYKNRGLRVEAELLHGQRAWSTGQLDELAEVISRLAKTDGLSSGREQESRLFLLAARFSLARRRPGAAVVLSNSAWLATRETDDTQRAQAIALRAIGHVSQRRLADALRVIKPFAILADAFRNTADGAPIQFVLTALHLAQSSFVAARKRALAFAATSEMSQFRWNEILKLLLLSEEAWWRNSPDRAMEAAASASEQCLPNTPFMLRCASGYQLLKSHCLAQHWPQASRCLADLKRDFRAVRFLRPTAVASVIKRRRILMRAFQPLAAFPCW